MLPLRQWVNWPGTVSEPSADSQAARDAEMVWRRAGNSGVRHPVDIIRTIDGDTFEARVTCRPGSIRRRGFGYAASMRRS